MMKNRSLSAWVVAAGVALAALGSVGTAQARDVHWTIGVGVPGVVVGAGNGYSVYTAPAPAYYAAPQPPVYYQPPPPVYYAPSRPAYYAPPAVYYPPPAYGYYRGGARHSRHDRDDHRYDRGGRGGWNR